MRVGLSWSILSCHMRTPRGNLGQETHSMCRDWFESGCGVRLFERRFPYCLALPEIGLTKVRLKV